MTTERTTMPKDTELDFNRGTTAPTNTLPIAPAIGDTTPADERGDGPPPDDVQLAAQVAANQRAGETQRAGEALVPTVDSRPVTAAGRVIADPFRAHFEKALPSMAAIASKYLKPERLLKIALLARSRDPRGLGKASPQSLLMAVMQAAEVGLEPNTPSQHAALIAYYNKNTEQTEAQFQIMYKGLIHLAQRHLDLRSARAVLVFEADHFDLDEGLDNRLVHKPNLTATDRGRIILGYAVLEFPTHKVWDWMTIAQMDHIKAKAKSGTGPWSTDPEEMYKKTVLKRTFKKVDVGEQFSEALAIEREDEEPKRLFGAGEDAGFDMLNVTSIDQGADLAANIRGGGRGKGRR